MKQTRYCMTIFEPEDVFETLVHFESVNPFMAIQRGDFINPSLWPELAERKDMKDTLLKVIHLEHGIVDANEHLLHILDIFTKRVENTAAVRQTGFLD